MPPIPEIAQHIPIIMTGDDIAKIVAASMLGLAVIIWLIARGPIGQAIGAAIRRMAGVDQHTALPGGMEALRSEMDALRRQLAEMAERQDFTERMLAQVRRERLPSATDVAG
jgi:hypothetical protein